VAGRDLSAATSVTKLRRCSGKGVGAPTSPLLEPAMELIMAEDFDDLYGSQYLAATDLKRPFTAVIEEIDKQDFARQGERQKMKVVLHLKGVKKPIVVNKTNALSLSEHYGKDYDEWVGKPVTVKAERTSYNGKPTMGLRLYPANGEDSPALKAPKSKKSNADFDDEIDI
jgi:hypothetical protein